MTLTWPLSRNSFHPAWLLLPAPALLALIGGFGADTNEARFYRGLRLVLSGLLVLPWLWWRASDASDSVRRWLKEFRTQLPGFLIAFLIPASLVAYTKNPWIEGVLLFYAFGCLWMGATALGCEFDQRTVSGWLAQPRARSALFLEKLSTLTFLLFVATLHFLLLIPDFSAHPDYQREIPYWGLAAAFALTSGPWFSLLTRSTLAGLVFTITVPLVLYVLTFLGLWGVYRWQGPEVSIPEIAIQRVVVWGLPLYWVTALGLAWSTFQRLEIRDSGGRTSSPLHPLSQPLDRWLARWLPANETGALIRKELRLQVLPWFVAAIMVGLWLLWLLARSLTNSEELGSVLNQAGPVSIMAGTLGVLVLLGTTSACVAEERELGTLEWQLTQPVSLARQWWVKVTVTAGLGLILGVALPAVLILIGFGTGPLSLPETWTDRALVFGVSSGAIAISLVLGIYASSFSGNTMKAAAATVMLGTGVFLVIALAGGTISEWQRSQEVRWTYPIQPLTPPPWSPTERQMTVLLALGITAIGLTFLGRLLQLAARNSRFLKLSARQLWRQWIGLSLGLFLTCLVAGGIVLQLTIWNQTANLITARQNSLDNLMGQLTQQAAAGQIPQEFYRRFNATPELPVKELANRILETRGWLASYEVDLIFSTTPPGLRSKVARDYGLTNALDPEPAPRNPAVR
jgi:ABC-2 family transporter protein